jgi:hypothetical protein
LAALTTASTKKTTYSYFTLTHYFTMTVRLLDIFIAKPKGYTGDEILAVVTMIKDLTIAISGIPDINKLYCCAVRRTGHLTSPKTLAPKCGARGVGW